MRTNFARNYVSGDTLNQQFHAQGRLYFQNRNPAVVRSRNFDAGIIDVLERSDRIPAIQLTPNIFQVQEIDKYVSEGLHTVYLDEQRNLLKALEVFEAPTQTIEGPDFAPIEVKVIQPRIGPIDPHERFLIRCHNDDNDQWPQEMRIPDDYVDVAQRIQLWLNRDNDPDGRLRNKAQQPEAGDPFTIQLEDVQKAMQPENKQWFDPREAGKLPGLEMHLINRLLDMRNIRPPKVRIDAKMGLEAKEIGSFAGITFHQSIKTGVQSVHNGNAPQLGRAPNKISEGRTLLRSTVGVYAENVPANHKLLVKTDTDEVILEPSGADGRVLLPESAINGFATYLIGPDGQRMEGRTVNLDRAGQETDLTPQIPLPIFDKSDNELRANITSATSRFYSGNLLTMTTTHLPEGETGPTPLLNGVNPRDLPAVLSTFAMPSISLPRGKYEFSTQVNGPLNCAGILEIYDNGQVRMRGFEARFNGGSTKCEELWLNSRKIVGTTMEGQARQLEVSIPARNQTNNHGMLEASFNTLDNTLSITVRANGHDYRHEPIRLDRHNFAENL